MARPTTTKSITYYYASTIVIILLVKFCCCNEIGRLRADPPYIPTLQDEEIRGIVFSVR